MVRAGDWKLIYYHGQPPQLFNLAEDPGELIDRAHDPACRPIRDELTVRVLDGWDPDWIKAKVEAKKADVSVLKAWATNTRPADQYRWPMMPEMNFLDS